MSIILTLLSPFDYVRIRHPLKRTTELWCTVLPGFGSALMVIIFPAINIFGGSGLISGLDSILSILPGFFITCLAAIATFSGAAYRIDDRFEGEAAILDGEALTRRQFLCHLFAYVSILSLALYFSGVFSSAIAAAAHVEFGAIWRIWLRLAFVASFSAILGNILGATLIGLVFLGSRMTRVSHGDRTKIRLRPEDQIHEDLDS